jgi:hypothetical protein
MTYFGAFESLTCLLMEAFAFWDIRKLQIYSIFKNQDSLCSTVSNGSVDSDTLGIQSGATHGDGRLDGGLSFGSEDQTLREKVGRSSILVFEVSVAEPFALEKSNRQLKD